MGFGTRNEDGRVFIDNVVFNSPAQKAGIDWDQEIVRYPDPDRSAAQAVDVHPGTGPARPGLGVTEATGRA